MRILLILLSISVIASGCTPANRAALGGGGVGAGIGAIIGHQSGKTAKGALIGGAIGTAAGGIAGKIAEQKFCPTCGKYFTAKDIYCPTCGTELQMKKK